MVRKRMEQQPPIELREFRSVEEIDSAVKKLERRIQELKQLDVPRAVSQHTGEEDVAASNVRETILDIFGPNSPEYREHRSISIWSGSNQNAYEAVLHDCYEHDGKHINLNV
jgi:hypothetical protein